MVWCTWMHECNNHTQGSSKAHQTKVMGKLIASLISIIHFGGLWFTPYPHPSSIDVKDTWTDQPWIKGLLQVTSMKSRLRTTQWECTMDKPDNHVLKRVPIVIISSFGYYRIKRLLVLQKYSQEGLLWVWYRVTIVSNLTLERPLHYVLK